MQIRKMFIQPRSIWFSFIKTAPSGIAARFLHRAVFTFSHSLTLRSFVGIGFHLSVGFQKLNPKKVLFVGLTTLVLLALTFSLSFAPANY